MKKKQDVENRQKCKFLVNVNVFAESLNQSQGNILVFKHCDLFQKILEIISPPLMKSLKSVHFKNTVAHFLK